MLAMDGVVPASSRAIIVSWAIAGLATACSAESSSDSGASMSSSESEATGDPDGSDADSVAEVGPGSQSSAEGGPSGSEGESGGEDTLGDPDDPSTWPRWRKLIQGDPYARLVVEIDAVEAFEPDPAVMQDLEGLFAQLLDKPGGIEALLDEAIPSLGPDHAWTDEELGDYAQTYRSVPIDEGDTVKIHVMFVDGHSQRDDVNGGRILGLAWGSNIAMFKRSLQASCNGVPPILGVDLCAETEYLVWTHEMGHVVGLVDGGLPMVQDHRDPDPENGRHDEDPDCVMYFGYASADAVDATVDRLLAGGEPPNEFDPACLADIEAAKAL